MLRGPDIRGFLWRFTLVYGLLIIPWPGFDRVYGVYFRAVNQSLLARDDTRKQVGFEAVPVELHHRLDSRLVLINRNQPDHDRNSAVRYVELDSRSIGWVPTALLLALILASPVSWGRRGWALVWGLLAIHGFILFSVASSVWNNAAEMSLLAFTPFWKDMAEGMEETLITQVGASFVVPVLIWIVVTFRRHDPFLRSDPPGREKPAGAPAGFQ